jgi:site-specific recombinase XerD
MTKIKWVKIEPGLEVRSHETRKHGKRFDRYLRGRFMVDGKPRTVSFGWESQWVAAEKSRMRSEGDRGPRMTFVEFCRGELARLKKNALQGAGPTTIREERELKEQKAQVETEAKEREEREAITFGQLFDDHYIPFVTAEGKKSVSQEKSIYKTWVKEEIGGKRAKDVSQIDIERIKHKVASKRSDRTTQYVLAVIRRVYNYAIEREMLSIENPTKRVKFPSPDNGRVRFFTKEQAEDLLTNLKSKSVKLAEMTEVSLYSGLRWGEVAKLLWADVDTNHGTLFVRDPKNKHSRTVPMPSRLVQMFQCKERGKASDMVFPSKKQEQSSWVSKTISRVIEDLGVNNGITDRRQKLTFHSCRHSFCSWLAMEGVALHVIAELAGHRNLKMTQRYSHLLPNTMKAAVDLLDKKPEPQAHEEKVVKLRKQSA